MSIVSRFVVNTEVKRRKYFKKWGIIKCVERSSIVEKLSQVRTGKGQLDLATWRMLVSLTRLASVVGEGQSWIMSQGELGKWGLFSMDYPFLTMRVVRKEGF